MKKMLALFVVLAFAGSAMAQTPVDDDVVINLEILPFITVTGGGPVTATFSGYDGNGWGSASADVEFTVQTNVNATGTYTGTGQWVANTASPFNIGAGTNGVFEVLYQYAGGISLIDGTGDFGGIATLTVTTP